MSDPGAGLPLFRDHWESDLLCDDYDPVFIGQVYLPYVGGQARYEAPSKRDRALGEMIELRTFACALLDDIAHPPPAGGNIQYHTSRTALRLFPLVAARFLDHTESLDEEFGVHARPETSHLAHVHGEIRGRLEEFVSNFELPPPPESYERGKSDVSRLLRNAATHADFGSLELHSIYGSGDASAQINLAISCTYLVAVYIDGLLHAMAGEFAGALKRLEFDHVARRLEGRDLREALAGEGDPPSLSLSASRPHREFASALIKIGQELRITTIRLEECVSSGDPPRDRPEERRQREVRIQLYLRRMILALYTLLEMCEKGEPKVDPSELPRAMGVLRNNRALLRDLRLLVAHGDYFKEYGPFFRRARKLDVWKVFCAACSIAAWATHNHARYQKAYPDDDDPTLAGILDEGGRPDYGKIIPAVEGVRGRAKAMEGRGSQSP